MKKNTLPYLNSPLQKFGGGFRGGDCSKCPKCSLPVAYHRDSWSSIFRMRRAWGVAFSKKPLRLSSSLKTTLKRSNTPSRPRTRGTAIVSRNASGRRRAMLPKRTESLWRQARIVSPVTPVMARGTPSSGLIPKTAASLLGSAEMVAPESTTKTSESHSPSLLLKATSAAGKVSTLPPSRSAIPYGKMAALRGTVNNRESFRDREKFYFVKGLGGSMISGATDNLFKIAPHGDNLSASNSHLFTAILLYVNDRSFCAI